MPKLTTASSSQQHVSAWRDPARPLDKRVDLLLAAGSRGATFNLDLVGTSATDLPCRGRVRLTHRLRRVGAERCLVTPVDVCPVTRSVED